MDVDLRNVRPYGDTMGDGAVQMSFTLPIPQGSVAREAARQLVLSMGFTDAQVVHDEDIGEGFTFFVVYGKTAASVDSTKIIPTEPEFEVWEREECNRRIQEYFGRPLVVVGACIGEDAHTVGIDAIMNMKGYHGHYGLERYSMIEAHNLGAQIPPEELLERARELGADAILVSQVVTQRDSHVLNLTRMIELVEAAGIRDRVVMVAGGPRIDNALAQELGYDVGFGKESYAEHVASFIIQELHRRMDDGRWTP